MTVRSRRVVRMRAVAGGVVLDCQDEVVPDLGPDDVLVRVRANSINFHDLAVMRGEVEVADGRIPLCDGAGVVLEVGAGVTSLAPGADVLSTFFPDWDDGPPCPEALARICGDSADGFAADHVVVPQHWLTRMPIGMDYAHAAAIPCAGVTAWNALKLTTDLGIRSVVVVQGTGGVALWALQLAKAHGAIVVALTSSPEKVSLLKALGADLVIDLVETPEWHEEVRQFTSGRGADLIIEVVGGANLSRAVSACRMGGQIALIGFLANLGAEIQIPQLLLNHIRITGLAVGSHADQIDLVRFIEGSKISPVIGLQIPITDLKNLIKFDGSSNQVGKIIVVN